MSDNIRNVPESLKALARLFESRNHTYGDSYKHAGKVFTGLFPRGLHLITEEDFNRFALFNHILNKVMRYAQMFDKGGHYDSLDDLSVYAQMLAEYDAQTWGGQK